MCKDKETGKAPSRSVTDYYKSTQIFQTIDKDEEVGGKERNNEETR